MNKIFVVIPAYNEGSRLKATIEQVRKHNPNLPLIVVDDGSSVPVDVTGKVTILRHQINLGKGAALKTGCDFAFKNGAQAVITMDADGQHDPKEITTFIRLLKDHDLVFGSRRPKIDAPLTRLLGNKFASIYINILFGVYISDILSGYRAFNRKAYQAIKWVSPRYGVETEMVARLGKHKSGLKFTEFPIETIYFDKYKGVTIVDALQILIHTIWWKLS